MIAPGDFRFAGPNGEVARLREVIAALDRRVRHPGRHTEAAIVGDAAALKQQARIGLLPSTKKRHYSELIYCTPWLPNELKFVVPSRVARRPDRR